MIDIVLRSDCLMLQYRNLRWQDSRSFLAIEN